MSIATSTDAPFQPRPRLRLVLAAEEQVEASGQREKDLVAKQRTLTGHLAYVLIAGADADTRSRMLGELRKLLPASTRFLEARETWELLARAADSRMVVLTDDLGDLSAKSLVRLLGRRHPTLPVLTVGAPAPASAPADVDVASM